MHALCQEYMLEGSDCSAHKNRGAGMSEWMGGFGTFLFLVCLIQKTSQSFG